LKIADMFFAEINELYAWDKASAFFLCSEFLPHYKRSLPNFCLNLGATKFHAQNF
jgi:hypothetical protein